MTIIHCNRTVRQRMYSDNSVSGEKGAVALILVIWVMVVLMAIVVQFTYSIRTELNITRNFKEEEEAYQLALAGIEKAKIEILSIQDPEYIHINDEGTLVFNDDEEEVSVREGGLGRGSYSYTIEDEDGKLNINTATLAQLKHIFLNSNHARDFICQLGQQLCVQGFNKTAVYNCSINTLVRKDGVSLQRIRDSAANCNNDDVAAVFYDFAFTNGKERYIFF